MNSQKTIVKCLLKKTIRTCLSPIYGSALTKKTVSKTVIKNQNLLPKNFPIYFPLPEGGQFGISENTPEKQKNRLLSPLRYPQYYNGMHTSPYASFVESPNAHSQTFAIFIFSTHFVDFIQTNLLTSTLLSSIMKLTGKQGD